MTPNQGVKKRVIQPAEISTEERGGYTAIVVEDVHGQEFSRLEDDNENAEDVASYWSEKYVGRCVEVTYTVAEGKFLNLVDFGVLKSEQDLDEPIDFSQVDEKSRRINRQNAQQHASRMVSARLDGLRVGTGSRGTDEEILSELEKWESVFRHHAETGEWQLPGDQQ